MNIPFLVATIVVTLSITAAIGHRLGVVRAAGRPRRVLDQLAPPD